jgi:hypothetical protein
MKTLLLKRNPKVHGTFKLHAFLLIRIDTEVRDHAILESTRTIHDLCQNKCEIQTKHTNTGHTWINAIKIHFATRIIQKHNLQITISHILEKLALNSNYTKLNTIYIQNTI